MLLPAGDDGDNNEASCITSFLASRVITHVELTRCVCVSTTDQPKCNQFVSSNGAYFLQLPQLGRGYFVSMPIDYNGGNEISTAGFDARSRRLSTNGYSVIGAANFVLMANNKASVGSNLVGDSASLSRGWLVGQTYERDPGGLIVRLVSFERDANHSSVSNKSQIIRLLLLLLLFSLAAASANVVSATIDVDVVCGLIKRAEWTCDRIGCAALCVVM